MCLDKLVCNAHCAQGVWLFFLLLSNLCILKHLNGHVYAVVNHVKFLCKQTWGTEKYFRCSYYNSEGCNAHFIATKVHSTETGFVEWKAQNLDNAVNHKHENAHTEHVLDEAKEVLKKILLKEAVDKRIKNIYFQFVEDYAKTLDKEDKAIFEDKFPTYKTLVRTLRRWRNERIPKGPTKQTEVNTKIAIFFNDNDEYLVIGDNTDELGK